MLHCEDVLPELSAYLDRELPVWKAQVIRWHLRRCSSCAEEAALLHQTDLLLRSVQDNPTSPELMTRILSQAQRLEKAEAHRHPLRWHQMWWLRAHRKLLVPALAALLLLAVGMALFRNSSPPPPPEDQDLRVIQVDLLFDHSARRYIVSGW